MIGSERPWREIVLEQVQVAASEHLPRGVAATAAPDLHLDLAMDALVFTLRAYVLAEDGGEPAVAKATAALAMRPWWIPKWLWKRVPYRVVTEVATCQPKWTYPHASLEIPRLGPPVRLVVPSVVVGLEAP